MHDRNHVQHAATQQNANCAITEAVCPTCKTPLYVYSTKIIAGTRKRYYHCPTCRHLPEQNVETIPLERAPRMPKKKVVPR